MSPSGSSVIPSTTSPIKQRHDPFNPVFRPIDGAQEDSGPSNWDYTENAPQGVVDAIAIERAREEKEGPPDMISGSLGSWGVEEGRSHMVEISCGEETTLTYDRRSILPPRFYTRTYPAWISS